VGEVYTTMMPLTLVFVTTDFPPDALASGIGTYTQSVASGMAQMGHRVHVVSRSTTSTASDVVHEITSDRVSVHRIGPPRLVLPRRMDAWTLTQRLAKGIRSEVVFRRRLAAFVHDLVRRVGADLVETADSAAEMLFYAPARHAAVPFVVRLHGPTAVHEDADENAPLVLRRAMGAMERRLLLRATHLTCPSQAAADRIRDLMNLTASRIDVFPNPVSQPLGSTDTSGPSAAEPGMVLFVGRVTRSKGVEVLARALPLMAASCPGIRLVVVGPDFPTSTHFSSTVAYLRHLIPSELHDRVSFEGLCTPEVTAGFFARAAVVVLPSLFDIFPYACLEAMAWGKAIVGSRNGGMNEMLADGAGLLYTPPDHVELAEAVVALLSDPNRSEAMGRRARARATGAYGRAQVLAMTAAYYERAVAETRGPWPGARQDTAFETLPFDRTLRST
jgi:glycogen synthase